MINFFSKIRFLLNYILPPTTKDLSDGTLKALKGLPDYEKIYLRNNVRTKKQGPVSMWAELLAARETDKEISERSPTKAAVKRKLTEVFLYPSKDPLHID